MLIVPPPSGALSRTTLNDSSFSAEGSADLCPTFRVKAPKGRLSRPTRRDGRRRAQPGSRTKPATARAGDEAKDVTRRSLRSRGRGLVTEFSELAAAPGGQRRRAMASLRGFRFE